MKTSDLLFGSRFDVSTRYGRMECFQDDLISRFLTLYGEWSFFETLFVCEIVKPKRIYDLGSYLGTFCLATQVLNPEFVLAVEANPPAYELLVRNLAKNLNVPYAAENFTVTDAQGDVFGVITQPGNLGSFSIETHNSHRSIACAPKRTLRSLRQEFGDYDFLKLDIEGGETNAILSDYQWIGANSPTIWAECNESQASIKLLTLLIELGYQVFFYRYPAFNSENFNRRSERVYPVAFEAGLLATVNCSSVCCPAASFEAGGDVISIKTAEDLRFALWLTPRWGRPEWVDRTKTELLALLSRTEAHQRLDDFLNS